jgi:DNA polymerase-3 subunit alpha
MGIKILPPDVNESDVDFVPVEEGIRFGLAAVRNVGRGAVITILESHVKGGRFTSLFDFCERIDLRVVNKRALESLIMAGAMDSLGGHRAQLISALDRAVEAAQVSQADRDRGQTSLFEIPALADDTAARSRILPDIPPWSEHDMLKKEKEMLGFFVSKHPLEQYADHLLAIITHTTADILDLRDGVLVRVGGLVVDTKTMTDKNGRWMAIVTLEDFSGTVEVVAFADTYEAYKGVLAPDAILVVKGKISMRGNGRVNIRADEFVELKEACRRFMKVVGVTFPFSNADETLLMQVRDICQQHPGPCVFLIHLKNGNGREYTIRSKNCTVTASDDLLGQLRTIVGPDKVWVE